MKVLRIVIAIVLVLCGIVVMAQKPSTPLTRAQFLEAWEKSKQSESFTKDADELVTFAKKDGKYVVKLKEYAAAAPLEGYQVEFCILITAPFDGVVEPTDIPDYSIVRRPTETELKLDGLDPKKDLGGYIKVLTLPHEASYKYWGFFIRVLWKNKDGVWLRASFPASFKSIG